MKPQSKPTRCAMFAITPKPTKLNTPVKPTNSQRNINRYKASGRPYRPWRPSSSIIKQ